MRKYLVAVTTVFMVASLNARAPAQEYSNEEILQKVQQLEQKVNELEKENAELKSLIGGPKNAKVTPRKRTKKLQVDGRILLRWTQSNQNYDKFSKTLYGDKGNGFEARKVRVKFHGKLNDNIGYFVHLRADKSNSVQLWDAFVDYKFNEAPLNVRMGLQKKIASMIYLRSGTKLRLPERPIAAKILGDNERDMGIRLSFKPIKQLKLETSVMNGESYSGSLSGNNDKKYAYTFAADTIPFKNENLVWRIRTAYETGYDYTKYLKTITNRRLFDIESSLKLRPINLMIDGGYLRDNPKDQPKVDTPDGYYAQLDYGLPVENLKNLHLVGRYSKFNLDDTKDSDIKEKAVGFYYRLNGWQAAVRCAYTWVNGNGNYDDKYDDFLTTEFQLLF